MIVDQLVSVLKTIMKSKGINYNILAKALDLSEASVKRVFSQQTFSLERFLEICDYVGVSLADLEKASKKISIEASHQYTFSQESFFSRNLNYLAYFDQLMNSTPLKIEKKYNLKPSQSLKYLKKLDDLEFILLLPGNKIKWLIPKNVVWLQNGPLRKVFYKQALNEFLGHEFDGDNELKRMAILDLSNNSHKKVIQKMEKIMEEIGLEADVDKLIKSKTKKIGLCLAVRPWNFSGLETIN